jgi:hypothetical protein
VEPTIRPGSSEKNESQTKVTDSLRLPINRLQSAITRAARLGERGPEHQFQSPGCTTEQRRAVPSLPASPQARDPSSARLHGGGKGCTTHPAPMAGPPITAAPEANPRPPPACDCDQQLESNKPRKFPAISSRRNSSQKRHGDTCSQPRSTSISGPTTPKTSPTNAQTGSTGGTSVNASTSCDRSSPRHQCPTSSPRSFGPSQRR